MAKNLTVYRPEHELISTWLQSMALQVAAGEMATTSASTYRQGLLKFVEWCHAEQVDVITSTAVRRWRASLSGRPTSQNTWWQGVKRYYEWAHAAGLVPSNPTAGIKNVKRKNAGKTHLKDRLTDREVLAVLAAPDTSTDQGKRDHAMLCLMAFCALRTVEIQRLDLDDLSTVDEQLVLRIQGKGSTDEGEITVVAHPTARGALLDWLHVRGKAAGPMFWSLSRRNHGERLTTRAVRYLADYISKAGIHDRRKTLHSLRHSAISKVARQDILAAQRLARHADISTTMVYVHAESRLDNPPEALVDYIPNGNGENNHG